MQSVTCLLDTGAVFSLISKDNIPADWLPERLESTTQRLYSPSKHTLKISGQFTLYLRNRNTSTITLFPVIHKLAIGLLLGTFIDEHELAVLPDKRKVTVRDANQIPIIAQGNKSANPVLSR